MVTDGTLQPYVCGILELLVAGEYKAVEELSSGIRLSAAAMEKAVGEYGRILIMPPASAWDLMDTIPSRSTDLPSWSVVMPLWTVEEGRSDLSLELTLIQRADGIIPEIDDIHVL